jgi:acetyl esterase/lipase
MRHAACALALFLAASAAAAGPLDRYYKDTGDRPRYAVPKPGEPVVGTQKTWYTMPYDLKPGHFSMNCDGLSAVTEESFEVTPRSVVGKFTYRFTPLEKPAGRPAENPLHDRQLIAISDVRFDQLAEVKDRNVLVRCTVTDVRPDGKGFRAEVPFAGGPVPCRVDVVAEEDVNRRPEVHSRQYGPHAKHCFDVYYPEGDGPFPMLVRIHGGGWGALDKMNNRIGQEADGWNERGIAFVSINYRYVSEYDQHPPMTVPVAAPLLDAVRCLQFIRYHAKALRLDPDRVCLTGGSAGGASSAWIALHDDMADPDSPDPVARMSTRVTCSTPHQAQTSLDPKQMREWIPQITYGAHAFFPSGDLPKKGPERFGYFLEHREDILPHIRAFSAYEHASADDPPMLLVYGGQPNVLPAVDGGNATHHPQFGIRLHDRLKELGVESYVWAGDGKTEGGEVRASSDRYHGWPGVRNFVVDKLLGGPPE